MQDPNASVHSGCKSKIRFPRRCFLGLATATSLGIALPQTAAASMSRLEKTVRIGVIADLHHDIMHDGISRMEAFVKQMAAIQPHALIQLGDFAYPNKKNRDVIQLFNQAHDRSLHVIGNHDTDAGHTKEQCLDVWGMTGRYYTKNIEGLHVVVLDGNDKGSPTHKGGYASYIGKEQIAWLKSQLATLDGPIVVACHQPLAGYAAIDNADEVQTILATAADKIILAINGHSHIDDVLRIQNVTYMHVNSASYQWVGGNYQHESYPAEVHAEHPWISYTCPYRNPLFATLTVDPGILSVKIQGRRSSWVGKSPAALGKDVDSQLTNGEEISPWIRDRNIERIRK